MTHKKCSRCGEEYPNDREHFILNKACRDGLSGTCKPCGRKYSQNWKFQRRDALAEKRRTIYAEQKGRQHKKLERIRAERTPYVVSAENLLSGIRTRAKERNLPVSEELRDKKFIISWLKNQQFCNCCGVKLAIGGKKEKRGPRDDSPSFDQIIPGDGYKLENVALVCWRCNNIKRNYSASDLRRVANWMDRQEIIIHSAIAQPNPWVRLSDEAATYMAGETQHG